MLPLIKEGDCLIFLYWFYKIFYFHLSMDTSFQKLFLMKWGLYIVHNYINIYLYPIVEIKVWESNYFLIKWVFLSTQIVLRITQVWECAEQNRWIYNWKCLRGRAVVLLFTKKMVYWWYPMSQRSRRPSGSISFCSYVY